MELQCKAQKLHKVITKQWLARELSLIQNLIDRDNKKGWCGTEKGWRKELFEYLERKLLLQKPTEQEGILFTVPDVIPEDLEPESTVQKSAKHEKSNICSPKLTIVGTSAENLEPESTVQKSAEDEKRNICCSPKITIVGTSAGIDEEGNTTSVKEANGRTSAGIDEEGNTTSVEEAIGVPSVVTLVEKLDINIGERTDIEPNITGSIVEGNHNSIEMKGSSEIAKNSKELELIDISEDTDDRQGVDDPDSALWFYEDPEQVIQGPFTARQLKTWKERNYFEQGFKVWKSGQTPVLLDDLISQMFPN